MFYWSEYSKHIIILVSYYKVSQEWSFHSSEHHYYAQDHTVACNFTTNNQCLSDRFYFQKWGMAPMGFLWYSFSTI